MFCLFETLLDDAYYASKRGKQLQNSSVCLSVLCVSLFAGLIYT